MKVLSDILHKAGVLKENAEAYSSGGYSILVRNNTTQRLETVSSVLPSQSGNAGEFLTTDGTSTSWAVVPPDTLDAVTTAGNTTTNSITVANVTATAYSIASTFWAGNAYKNNNNGNMSMAFSGQDILLMAGQASSNEVIRIYGNTLNVGIGTAGVDAGYKFDVGGTSRFGGNITLSSGVNITTSNQFYGITTNYLNSIFVGWDASAVYLGYSMGALPIHLGSNGSGQIWFRTTGNTKIDSLAGTGSRMVVADSSGVLSTQSVPTGDITGTGAAGQVAYWTGTSTQAGSNNLFWDNANGRLGIGTNAPSYGLHLSNKAAYIRPTNNSDDALHISNQGTIVFRGTDDAITTRFRGITSGFQFQDNAFNIRAVISIAGGLTHFATNGGNVAIGTNVDGGQRLQVNGDTLLKGSGNTSATTALTVQNSGGDNMLSVRNDQFVTIGTLSGQPTLSFGGGNITIFRDFSDSSLTYRNTFSVATVHKFTTNSNLSNANTSGTNSFVSFLSGYAPTSGTGTWVQLSLTPTINQTGGANGITRGLYINPTLTSAADWRSVEWSNNTGFGLYGAGSATNYLNGALGIGTTTPSQKLSVSGNSQINHTYTHTTGSFTSGLSAYVAATTQLSPSYTSGMFYGALNTFYQNEFEGSATIPNSVVMASQFNGTRVKFVNTASTITVTQGGSGVRSIANQILQFSFDTAQTSCVVSHVAGSQILAPYYVGANNPTITNYYGLAINPSDEYSGTLTVTNRWGIYQSGTADNNWFAGKVIIGSTNTIGSSNLNVKNLPTSSAGLSSGDVWNDAGTLKIV